MKPFQAFLYILIILSGFLLVSYFFSKTGPSLVSTNEVKDNRILTKQIVLLDSLKIEHRDTVPLKITPVKTEKSGIQFLSGDSVFFDSFFSKLKNQEAYHAPLRIMYFGDSQIEGDRITSAIRKQFQQKFGGAGIGFVPPEPLYNLTHSFSIKQSENWQHFSVLDRNDTLINRSLVFKEAILPSHQKGWFKIKQVRNKKNKADYSQLKMFYCSRGGFTVTVKEGGTLIYKGEVSGTAKIKALNFNFTYTPASIELYFQSTDSLEVFNFSLEKQTGVLVDNIALRGFSFPPFSTSDQQAMRETICLINPGLCVFHFGVNLAPWYREDYNYYRIRLVREIRRVQQLMPGVPVLIVGISDMAKKEKGAMVSYPNIKAIKEAQQEAARICNCSFWDLEKFMGGPGSMVRWVNAEPRLGQKDYIHFTREGTEKIGNRLSNLILDEYEKYLKAGLVE